MGGCLEAWCQCVDLPTPLAAKRDNFIALIGDHNATISENVEAAVTQLALGMQDGWKLFGHAAWLLLIDLDPLAPNLMSRPRQPGGRARRAALREALLGLAQ